MVADPLPPSPPPLVVDSSCFGSRRAKYALADPSWATPAPAPATASEVLEMAYALAALAGEG